MKRNILLVLSLSSPLQAQIATDTTHLAPVVITATRESRAQGAAGSSATVITGEELRARGVVHLDQALATVPGVSVIRSGSEGSQTSVFVRGGERKYAKVLVDGVPLNDPGGAVDLANVTIDDVERIEIVRGPASVLYGSDAVSGVIQIFTRHGMRGSSLRATALGGTFGSGEQMASASGGSDLARGALTWAHHATDGYLPFNSGWHEQMLSAHGAFNPDNRNAINLGARYTDALFHYPTNGAGQPVDSNAMQLERRLLINADAERRLGDRFDLHLYATDDEVATRLSDQPDSPGDTADFYFHQTSTLSRRAIEVRASSLLPLQSIATVGAQLEGQQEADRSVSQFMTFPATPDSFTASRTNRAAYAQLLSGTGTRASLSLSTRVDDNSQFGSFGTWRAAGELHPFSGTRLHSSVGTSFKEPSFTEQYSTAFTRGNPDLVPEHALGWDAGVEQSLLDDRVTLGATYFAQRFKDMIQYVYVADPDSVDYYNVAGARANGAELDLRVAPTSSLWTAASYTWLDTKVTDEGFGSPIFAENKPLIRRPRHEGSLTVGARAFTRTTLTATVHRVGGRDDFDYGAYQRVRMPWYTTVDASAEVALPALRGATHASVLARAENLTNEKYEAVQGYRAMGRRVMVGVSLER